jgi:hypothetical protein
MSALHVCMWEGCEGTVAADAVHVYWWVSA